MRTPVYGMPTLPTRVSLSATDRMPRLDITTRIHSPKLLVGRRARRDGRADRQREAAGLLGVSDEHLRRAHRLGAGGRTAHANATVSRLHGSITTVLRLPEHKSGVGIVGVYPLACTGREAATLSLHVL